jgi:hypothetical protein
MPGEFCLLSDRFELGLYRARLLFNDRQQEHITFGADFQVPVK